MENEAKADLPKAHLWTVQLVVVFAAISLWCFTRLPPGWGLGWVHGIVFWFCYLQIPFFICLAFQRIAWLSIERIPCRGIVLTDGYYLLLGAAHVLLIVVVTFRLDQYSLPLVGFINLLYLIGMFLEVNSNLPMSIAFLGLGALNVLYFVLLLTALTL